MKKSYLGNYLKTYLWQGIGMILNLASMFIVIPMITNNKVIYGVYSVCISTAMFLSYADLGFVTAGIKYAGESFARGDGKDEIKYYGFSGFVLFVFVAAIAGVYFLFAYKPSLLIKDIGNSQYLSIASKLLFIQAVFSFNTVLNRYVNGAFQVRIEEYKFQRINISGNLLKIVSVFYFFGAGKYDIVGYYLFIKLVQLGTFIVGAIYIDIKYKLSFLSYLRAFHFNRQIYRKTKGLAFGSLFVTIMWILYYELDIIVIGKLLGAAAVAVFALAFTFIKFLRSLSSIVFSPFQNRYNHLVGLNDVNGLKVLVKKVVLFAMPIFVLGIFSIILLNQNIVLSWAGIKYSQSGIILTLLGIRFMYSFIMVPGSNMLTALVKIKEMYLVNFIMVVVYWAGIFLTINRLGVISFAAFKLISGTLVMLFYLKFILGFLKANFFKFFKETALRIIIPVILEIAFLFALSGHLPATKGKVHLAEVILAIGAGTLLGFITLYFTSGYYKKEFNHYFARIINRNK